MTASALAGVGLNARLGTSRSSGNSAIVHIVIKSRDSLGRGVSASALTRKALNARLGTSGILGNKSLVHIVVESVYSRLSFDMLASYASLVRGIACLGAGSRSADLINKSVVKRIYSLGRCMTALSLAGKGLNTLLGTSRSYGNCALVHIVAERGNDLLSSLLAAIAARTVATADNARRIAGCRNCRNGVIGVAERQHLLLRGDDIVTYRAVLTLCKTRLGAGGSYSRIDSLGVSERCNSLLLFEYLVAYRAVLALGKTRLGTGRRYCPVLFLGVAKRRNGLLHYKNPITHRAMLTLGKTCLGTGRRYRLIYNLCVRCGGDIRHYSISAVNTRSSLLTFHNAGRRYEHGGRAHIVIGLGYLHTLCLIITAQTGLIRRVSYLGAGSGDLLVSSYVMSKLVRDLFFDVAASCRKTEARPRAVLGASSLDGLPL